MANWEESKWQDWTPTVDQNGSVAATVTYARYMVIGNAVILTAKLDVTGTGSAGSIIEVESLPFVPTQTGVFSIGSGLILDLGTAFYSCSVVAFGSDTLRFVGYNEGDYIGSIPNFALASGDGITLTTMYERS